MFLRGYFEARAVPQAGSERGHAQSCAGGAGGCCAPGGEGMLGEGVPCTHVSGGLPPTTRPQGTGCKQLVEKQLPPTVVSQESQDSQRYFRSGDTNAVFSVPDKILSS